MAVAACVMIAGSFPGDRRALVALHDVVGTSMDDLMVAVGDATDTAPLVGFAAAVAALLLWARRPMDASCLLLGVGVACSFNPVLKEVVERSRPDVWASPESVSRYSFPSGHAAGTAALVGGLVMVVRSRRRRLALSIGAVVLGVVAFSRLAVGVHYPSDIVAGWLWAGAWIALLWSARASLS